MIRPSLVRNYILLSIIITISVLFIGFATSSYLTQLQRERERLAQPPPNILAFVARLMDQLEPDQPRVAFAKLKTSFEKGVFSNFWLLNQEGQVIASTEAAPLPFQLEKEKLPQGIYESLFIARGPTAPPSPPPLLLFHWSDSAKGPPGPPPSEVVRLKNKIPTYLAAEFRPRVNNQNSDGLIFQGSLLLSIVMASLLTFGFISWHVRRKARMAEEVMSRMQGGDLKARFPVQKHDEVGSIMLLFNKMGDEIERLVEQIRATEKSRVFILQELAHDLRTPIASLKSMLETLEEGEQVPPPVREELMQMSLEEVHYFARLVEDLLLLAQILEPQYQSPFQEVPWFGILSDEVAKINLQIHLQQSTVEGSKKVALTASPAAQLSHIMGDENLLRRVFRNTLQNAMTFAKSSVQVEVELGSEGKLKILFRDDGPGFSPSLLLSYGERKVSRYLKPQDGGHLSVGLGSVIIKKVVLAHKGSLSVRNRESQGHIEGAEVLITLPLAIS